MSITSKFLKDIMAEARPIIERQIDDAKIISGFQKVVSANGGDWGALKALIKAHIEDENDETGDGKRVQKILDKADSSSAYAGMLGLANMNENNFSADNEDNEYAAAKGLDPKLAEMVVKGVQTETGRAALITAIDIMIEREERETNSPETATEYPAQVMRHPEGERSTEGGAVASPAPRNSNSAVLPAAIAEVA